MNDSFFASKLKRQLYNNAALLMNRSRTYTLANSLRIVVRSPEVFIKKAAHLTLRNPRKLVQIATGRRDIQDISEDRQKLDVEYAKWIEQVEGKSFDKVQQAKDIENFSQKPLVSLITPVFNPPQNAHNELIKSVTEQTYEHFELLLFNFGDDPEIKRLLDDWAKKDSRIHVKHDLPNEGISKNSNLCLEHVKGDFVGLLDHDDALMPNALYECVKAVNEHDAEFIYTDKDKITEEGKRHEAFFKPDLSPEMLFGGNYLTHFNLMKVSIIKDLGGWDPEMDGAQDWDLFLRILDATNKVAHVPKIVYHWRTVAGSTSSSMQVKPYALQAQLHTVNKHLQKHNLPGKAIQDETGQTYVRWSANKPSIYIVHVAHGDIANVKKILNKILPAIKSDSEARVCIFTENNTLKDKQLLTLEKQAAGFELIKYGCGEFASALTKTINTSDQAQVAYISDSLKHISTSQDDTTWFKQLGGWLSIPDVNLAGGAIYSRNGQVLDIGSFFNPQKEIFEKYYFSTGFRSGYSGYVQWIRNFIMVSERAFVFNSLLLETEDWTDLMRKIRDDEFASTLSLINFARGGRAVYDPTVQITDNASFYVSLPLSSANASYVTKNCRELWKGDPYYNPNLNDNYINPKPGQFTESRQDKLKLSSPTIRTIEVP